MNPIPTFSEEDIKAFEPEMKIGLLATVNPAGLPHLTLISTLRASGPRGLVWGQFAEGLSKVNILQNPKAAFLILTLDKNIWRGKAIFTHTANSGKEFELLNSLPMFRYNAYFGIHRVYYLDLIEQYGREPLPMNRIISAAIKTMLARTVSPASGHRRVLNQWTRQLINKMDNLKFVAYIGADGYPVIIPAIQMQAAGTDQVLFSAGAYSDELRRIPAGSSMACFGMAFSMEDVLLRGIYRGLHRRGGLLCAVVDIDWVYNPMPPKAEQIYPPTELEVIKDFS